MLYTVRVLSLPSATVGLLYSCSYCLYYVGKVRLLPFYTYLHTVANKSVTNAESVKNGWLI
jgi:hypothetical protein